jgi:hypothetical protein
MAAGGGADPGACGCVPVLIPDVGGERERAALAFRSGIWTYRLSLGEIQTVAPVRNSWWYGFGIRIGPHFRLYNVSGLDAVELQLKSSEVRRIGTDDPQGLAQALKLSLRGG